MVTRQRLQSNEITKSALTSVKEYDSTGHITRREFSIHANNSHKPTWLLACFPNVVLPKRNVVASFRPSSQNSFALQISTRRRCLLTLVPSLTVPTTFLCSTMPGVSRVIVALVASLCVVDAFLLTANHGRHASVMPRNMLEGLSEPAGDDRRLLEFTNLEPIEEPEARRKRIEQEEQRRSRFVSFGDDLWDLRKEMDKLSLRLLDAINDGEDEREKVAREKLRKIEMKDPELVYMLELAEAESAAAEGNKEEAAQHQERAMAARSCLPQFNLDGLWVGKYGSHGYELINVTYAGDTLIATKLTGDKNVPRGEITFQVDLHPLRFSNAKKSGRSGKEPQQALAPIALTEQAARKWGTRKLPRYGGLGQVAEEGFSNNQWMDGQLIIIGDNYFSFAWVPIEQQIFFGRPSAELALKMLREAGVAPLRTPKAFPVPPTLDDSIDIQKEFAQRCLEKTDEIEDEQIALGCIFHDEENPGECYFE